MPVRINSGPRIGHVHLKVADIERSVAFYCGVLGFKVTQRLSPQLVLISAGAGYHHHIALNTRQSLGGSPPSRECTGLDHFAILYPTRAGLTEALRRLMAAHIDLEKAAGTGISESDHVRDPDGNRVDFLGPPHGAVATHFGWRSCRRREGA